MATTAVVTWSTPPNFQFNLRLPSSSTQSHFFTYHSSKKHQKSRRSTINAQFGGTSENPRSNTFSNRMVYRRLDYCIVIPPFKGKKPKALIKFLGGAFIGAVPEVTYRWCFSFSFCFWVFSKMCLAKFSYVVHWLCCSCVQLFSRKFGEGRVLDYNCAVQCDFRSWTCYAGNLWAISFLLGFYYVVWITRVWDFWSWDSWSSILFSWTQVIGFFTQGNLCFDHIWLVSKELYFYPLAFSLFWPSSRVV